MLYWLAHMRGLVFNMQLVSVCTYCVMLHRVQSLLV